MKVSGAFIRNEMGCQKQREFCFWYFLMNSIVDKK